MVNAKGTQRGFGSNNSDRAAQEVKWQSGNRKVNGLIPGNSLSVSSSKTLNPEPLLMPPQPTKV